MEGSIPEAEAARGEHLAVINKQTSYQRWFFSVSTCGGCLCFFPMLSNSRYLDIPTYSSLVLTMTMSRWDLELGSAIWERWLCDTWVGSRIFGFTLLLCVAWIQQQWLPSALSCWLQSVDELAVWITAVELVFPSLHSLAILLACHCTSWWQLLKMNALNWK